MDLITITHADFLLEISQEYIDAEKVFAEIFKRAKERNTEKYFTTTYCFSDKPLLHEFSIWDPEKERLRRKSIESAHYPVFFENMEYTFTIEFLADISEPKIYSKNKQITRAFKSIETIHGSPFILGNLSFKHSVGAFELNINYNRGTIPKTVIFRFDVFSSAVALKRDIPLMVQDIEKILPRLILDYVKITDHPFYNNAGDFSKIMWWIIFDNIYKDILEHIQLIITYPYIKEEGLEIYAKGNDIRKPSTLTQSKVSRVTGNPNKFFATAETEMFQDNDENRIVKFIIRNIIHKFKQVYSLVKGSEAGKRITNEYRAQLEFSEKALQSLIDHPVFQHISDIGEINIIPQLMTMRNGYGSLINDWNKLNEGYGLFDGLYTLELKDSYYVYKLWCFMNIAEIIESLGGKLTSIVKVPEIIPNQFVFTPDKEMNARLIFKFDNGDIIELYMELLYNNNSDTESIRPDIVLRVRKSDLPSKMHLTYLFDAKYRWTKSKDDHLPDVPHLNDESRMHYFKNIIYKGNRQRRDIMGIGIFYPALGTLKQFEDLQRQTSVEDVMKIPFNPGQTSTNNLVKKWISHLINTDAAKLLKEAAPVQGDEPQKEEVFVFIPFIKKGDTLLINYLKHNMTPLFIYEKFLTPLGDGVLRYFAPYIEGEGIIYVWEIVGHDWKARKDVYPPDHELFQQDITECLVLKLRQKTTLKEPLQVKGVIKTMRYTKMRYINNPVNGFIKTIPKGKLS